MSDRTGTTEAREEGFYWVILGQNPPEIAYWERGEWWLAGDPKTVAARGGNRRQRSAGVQAAIGASGMMVRSGWRYHDDDWPERCPFPRMQSRLPSVGRWPLWFCWWFWRCGSFERYEALTRASRKAHGYG